MGGIGAGGGIDILLCGSDVARGICMTQEKLMVLLAEDNPGDVFLVRRALDGQRLCYELLVANDGEEAINYVAQAADGTRKVDLLLLDLNLPRYDGAAVLAYLRGRSTLANVPVILLTSSDSPQDRERCLALGASRYFQKPTNLAAFMEIGLIAKQLVERQAA